MHAQEQGDLRKALAVHDREDGEEILDLIRTGPSCWAVFNWCSTSLGYEGDMVKLYAAHRTFLHQ